MYAKVFRSLWEGSMRGRCDEQLVFVYMLCHSDADGICDIIHAKIASDTGLPEERVRSAVTLLETEDGSSRSPDANGRRIVRLDEHRDWGWLIVNYPKYRLMSDIEKIREQNRLRARSHRERLRNKVTESNVTQRDLTVVTESNDKQKHRNKAEAEEDADTKTKTRPSGDVRRGVSRKSLENGERLPEGEITADEAFEEIFWPEYPRKTKKKDAMKAWKSLRLKDDDEARIASIMAALRRDVKQEWRDRPPDKIPYPATWLRSEGWLDGA